MFSYDDDQLSGIRQIRRLTHPVRTSNFGSRPTRGPGPVMQLIEPSSAGMSPTSRDTMDPIAGMHAAVKISMKARVLYIFFSADYNC